MLYSHLKSFNAEDPFVSSYKIQERDSHQFTRLVKDDVIIELR